MDLFELHDILELDWRLRDKTKEGKKSQGVPDSKKEEKNRGKTKEKQGRIRFQKPKEKQGSISFQQRKRKYQIPKLKENRGRRGINLKEVI